MHCCVHILNLTIKEGLRELDDSIIRIHNIIKYMKSSLQRVCGSKKVVAKIMMCENIE